MALHLPASNHVWHVLPAFPSYFMLLTLCCRIPVCHMFGAAASRFASSRVHVASYIFSAHYLRTITPRVWYLSFWIRKERRSKEIIIAVSLRCSVATQANFSSAALIAYTWNEITSHSVGGLRNFVFFFFFFTFSLPQSLTPVFCL